MAFVMDKNGATKCNLVIQAHSKTRGVNRICILENACCARRGGRGKKRDHCAKGNPQEKQRACIKKLPSQLVGSHRVVLESRVRWGNFAASCKCVFVRATD